MFVLQMSRSRRHIHVDDDRGPMTGWSVRLTVKPSSCCCFSFLSENNLFYDTRTHSSSSPLSLSLSLLFVCLLNIAVIYILAIFLFLFVGVGCIHIAKGISFLQSSRFVLLLLLLPFLYMRSILP